MIITDKQWLEADFAEESKFFEKVTDDMKIIHSSDEKDGFFLNEVSVNGKTYSFADRHVYKNEIEHKRYFRRYAKLALYKALSDFTGEKPEWGALTGIRPVKFAYSEGAKWREVMGEEMEVSPEKLDMVGRIIEAQKGIYQISDENADFFVSIPFCPSRCAYCSFVSNEIGKEKHVHEYVSALCDEIEATKPLFPKYRSFYVGGGTPISLPLPELERVLNAIGSPNVEYTVEAGRPDCITDEVLTLLKEKGVTRICVNPQTFNDKTLAEIGRKHTAKDIIDKFALARKYGFDINMDLIAGLTGETFDDFRYSMDTALELDPDNLTVHTLSLKKGSVLKEKCDRLPAGEIKKMIDYSAYKSINAGFSPYYMYRQKYMAGNLENTGYTKPGKSCVYNIDVMEEISSNPACGANGVSKRLFAAEDRIERYGAPKDIKIYRKGRQNHCGQAGILCKITLRTKSKKNMQSHEKRLLFLFIYGNIIIALCAVRRILDAALRFEA